MVKKLRCENIWLTAYIDGRLLASSDSADIAKLAKIQKEVKTYNSKVSIIKELILVSDLKESVRMAPIKTLFFEPPRP